MALISCPDCGSQVSERAPTCPRCGAPVAATAAAPAGGILPAHAAALQRLPTADPPCRQCGTDLVPRTERVRHPDAMKAGWILGGFGFGLPLLAFMADAGGPLSVLLGIILVIVGIVLQTAIKKDKPILLCPKCGAVRELPPALGR